MKDFPRPHPLLYTYEAQRRSLITALTWDAELAVYRRFSLRDGCRVLEISDGVTSVAPHLLTAFPTLDLSIFVLAPDLLPRLQTQLGDRAAHITWITGDLASLNLPDAAFDIALARYICQHLADPVGLSRAIYRALAPDGRLIIADIDEEAWGVMAPESPEFAASHAARIAVQAAAGENALIGRALPQIIQSAGFSASQLECVVAHSSLIGFEPFDAIFTLDDTPVRLLANAGFIPPPDTLRDAWAAWRTQPDPLVMLNLFVASGCKVAGEGAV